MKFMVMMKFTGEMKLRTLRWGDYPGLSTGPNLITQDLKSEKSFPVWSEGAVVMGGWSERGHGASFEDKRAVSQELFTSPGFPRL